MASLFGYVGFFLVVTTTLADARVTRIEISRQEPLAAGQPFGEVGGYENVIGRFHGELDPAQPLNAVIVDLDKAPRNARGMVEYSSDFYILRPIDLAKGNGALLYDVNNRGNKNAPSQFNSAPAQQRSGNARACRQRLPDAQRLHRSCGAAGFPACRRPTTHCASRCRPQRPRRADRADGLGRIPVQRQQHQRRAGSPSAPPAPTRARRSSSCATATARRRRSCRPTSGNSSTRSTIRLLPGRHAVPHRRDLSARLQGGQSAGEPASALRRRAI